MASAARVQLPTERVVLISTSCRRDRGTPPRPARAAAAPAGGCAPRVEASIAECDAAAKNRCCRSASGPPSISRGRWAYHVRRSSRHDEEAGNRNANRELRHAKDFHGAVGGGSGIERGSGARGQRRPRPAFGPDNPFYAPSPLPFHAPPFDRIKDEDYQPAIEAGMAQQLAEVRAIADNPAAPTFENTLIPLEKSGALLDRALQAFHARDRREHRPDAAGGEERARAEARRALRRHLPERRSCSRESPRSTRSARRSGLDAESQRLAQVTYDEFVHAGASLSAARQGAAEEAERGGIDAVGHVLQEAARRQRRGRVRHADGRRRSPA